MGRFNINGCSCKEPSFCFTFKERVFVWKHKHQDNYENLESGLDTKNECVLILQQFVDFGGALLMAALIYSLAWNQGSSPILLILMGIGLSAIASAITSLMITYGEIYDVSNAFVWLAGSVYGRTWER